MLWHVDRQDSVYGGGTSQIAGAGCGEKKFSGGDNIYSESCRLRRIRLQTYIPDIDTCICKTTEV